MSKLRERLLAVATSYAAERKRSLLRFLGDGNDGAVWESDQHTAIKALERRDSYLRERDAYLRLQDHGIVDIQGFAVPCLIDLDDTKQIVEMTVSFRHAFSTSPRRTSGPRQISRMKCCGIGKQRQLNFSKQTGSKLQTCSMSFKDSASFISMPNRAIFAFCVETSPGALRPWLLTVAALRLEGRLEGRLIEGDCYGLFE
jgi:hypothetical protein